MDDKNNSTPSKQRAKRSLRRSERASALGDDEKLDHWELEFAYGRKVPVNQVKKLTHSRRLNSRRRADAWELLAFLYIDRGQDDLANDAHDKAFKIGRSTEYLVFKADFVRNRGVEEACKLLQRVNVSELPEWSRRSYWITLMDTAMLTFKENELKEAVGQIWKRDLSDPSVRHTKARCLQFMRMLRNLI